jgi:hypothetical protein
MTFEILTPSSSRWNLFVERLEDVMTRGVPEGSWRCGDDGSGGSKHRYAKQVMAEIGGIDIPTTLEFFHEHGGHCDCEVLLNVDQDQAGAA